jgi:hypothetical protein
VDLDAHRGLIPEQRLRFDRRRVAHAGRRIGEKPLRRDAHDARDGDREQGAVDAERLASSRSATKTTSGVTPTEREFTSGVKTFCCSPRIAA